MTVPIDRNRLDRETSPYLLQHQHNPVHWQPWDADALALAQNTNKPILLSVGYAACHWCHVMAHESFENPRIAAVMNAKFVNIKVDREERPDLDTIYQSALAMLGQHGGWPLTMFLTPAAEPFWGGTYFPPTAHYGRPGFTDVLDQIERIYRQSPDQVAANVAALGSGLAHLQATAPGGEISLATIDRAAKGALGAIDLTHGGLAGAPKFPHTALFELLWRAHLRGGGTRLREAVTTTCDRMCQGGIYDHLGGGFSRYATDAQWLAPHFEKMLYDNAQLIDLLTLVWQDTGAPLHEARIRETVAWVLREMIAEGGGFAASLDADSEGEEGRFYVWDSGEIDRLLGNESAAFKDAYDIRPGGNWEGHSILNRLHRPALDDAGAEAALGRQREILLEARAARPRPGWDDKVLADWNGLMIAALANAGAVFGEPDWIAAAVGAFDFVGAEMAVADRLYHVFRDGRANHAGLLDDYAHMARAALVLHEVAGEAAYLDRARAWTGVLDRHFWDGDAGGYHFTADDSERLIVRVKTIADNATPSGNGVMTGVLGTLHHLTGAERYRIRADALVRAFAGQAETNPLAHATFINNIENLITARQVVVIGDRESADTQSLLGACRRSGAPALVLATLAPHTPVPDGHPAAGKTQIDGKATAYLCIGATCSPPLTDPAAVAAALRVRAVG